MRSIATPYPPPRPDRSSWSVRMFRWYREYRRITKLYSERTPGAHHQAPNRNIRDLFVLHSIECKPTDSPLEPSERAADLQIINVRLSPENPENLCCHFFHFGYTGAKHLLWGKPGLGKMLGVIEDNTVIVKHFVSSYLKQQLFSSSL